jgi:hypothetical protein
MTKLLNIEGVTVKSYQIIENIGITIYLDNNKKAMGASHICKNTSSGSFLLPSSSFLLAPDS